MFTERRRRRERKKKTIRIFILCVAIGVIVLCTIKIAKPVKSASRLQSPIPSVTKISEVVESPTDTPIPLGNNSQALGDTIQDALTNTHGSYGIVVKDLKSGETYYQNANTVYESGSLYKLWVMATVYDLIAQGKLHDNDVMSRSAADLNREFGIDPSNADQTQGTTTYTIHDALYQMITISDNEAALLLTDKVGLSNIANFLKKNGFTHSKLGTGSREPTTTAYDVAFFFEKLYTGKIADMNYSNKMLDLLKAQKLNEKIPLDLPDDVTIAHKTGELDTFSHDAGIVFAPNTDYILVVLSDSDNRDEANQRIADVSKNVYDYFSNKEE